MKKSILTILVLITVVTLATLAFAQRPQTTPQDYYEDIAACHAEAKRDARYIAQLESTNATLLKQLSELQKELDGLKAVSK
jgi:hypothetical protein